MKYLRFRNAVCTILFLSPVTASAHAHLDHASPAVGSTVASAPKEVALWFTEALEPKFSSIEVRDAKGAAVQAGKAVLDPSNSAELRVPLKPLAPGTYKVIWRVLSVDTHRTQGDFTFSVGR
jgi:methionine-rich copper-binding protein CopC